MSSEWAWGSSGQGGRSTVPGLFSGELSLSLLLFTLLLVGLTLTGGSLSVAKMSSWVSCSIELSLSASVVIHTTTIAVISIGMGTSGLIASHVRAVSTSWSSSVWCGCLTVVGGRVSIEGHLRTGRLATGLWGSR